MFNFKKNLLNITPYGLQLKKHARIKTISEDFPSKWLNVLHQTEHKLVHLILQDTKLVHPESENKFHKDLLTNFPQNHTDIKNDIINRNLTLKITLSDRRKKKWQKVKRKKRIIRTLCKFTKVSDFVEVALEPSMYVNVSDNRKHRKKIIQDSRQERNDGSLTHNLNNFSGNKEAPIEEQFLTNTSIF